MCCKPIAIFLSGPIGVGKSTLARAVARAIGGHFVEGDEHAPADRAWYAASLSTHRSILAAVTANVAERRPVVVAYPLTCINWIFYRRRLADAGVALFVVSLFAAFEAITRADRGRCFSEAERRRIGEMIEQGYDRREFSDLLVRTDAASFEATVQTIVDGLPRRLE